LRWHMWLPQLPCGWRCEFLFPLLVRGRDNNRPQVLDGFFGLSAWLTAAEVWIGRRFHGRRCRFLSSSSLFASRTAGALSMFKFCLAVWIGQRILWHWLASRSNLEGGCVGAPVVGCGSRVHQRRAVLWRGGRSYLYFLFFLGCLLQRAGVRL
jgi:hypothetical protein